MHECTALMLFGFPKRKEKGIGFGFRSQRRLERLGPLDLALRKGCLNITSAMWFRAMLNILDIQDVRNYIGVRRCLGLPDLIRGRKRSGLYPFVIVLRASRGLLSAH